MEFHRYPHVIPALFNGHEFGPPRDFTLASTCTWIGHPVSGLQHATTALLRLAFATAPVLQHLNLATYRNSLARSTKSTWSLALPLLVSIRFQVLFHSPPGVLFTFPSRYYSTIGHRLVFRLGGWAPRLHTGFHLSGATLVPLGLLLISRTGLLPSSVCLSRQLLLSDSCFVSGPQPHTKVWFGLFPFRSPLLRESMFLSLPPAT